MSEANSPGPGWWLASDGNWYPPELAPSTPTVAPAPVVPPQLPTFPAFGTIPPTVQPAQPQWPTPGGTPPGSAGNGNPYYPAYPPPWPGLAEPKTSPMAIWSLILVIALGALGALAGIPMAFVARSKIRRSGGTLKGSGLALAALIVGFIWIGLFLLAIAIPVFIGVTHSGPSVQSLDASVLGQISGTGPGDFNDIGVSTVNCQLPAQWTTGSTFTCLAYDPSGTEVGSYSATVSPNGPNGTYEWYGRYTPSP